MRQVICVGRMGERVGHLAHGTRKAAHGGREGKSSLVRGTRTRLGEEEFLRKKSLYRRMYMPPQDFLAPSGGQKKPWIGT